MRDRNTNGSEDPGQTVSGPLDLNLLRTFLTVYRTGSFTAAARLLGLSQPTVTTQIRTLERQLGRELFERRARGVTPAPYADELAARIVNPLDSLAMVAGPAGGAEDAPPEPVHLAGPAELLSRCVLPGLAPLVDKGVRLRITPGLTEPLLDDLRAGRHDLVIATFRPRGRTLTAVPLNDEEFVLVASPTWAQRLGAPASVAAALHGVPLVAYADDLPIVRRYWRHVFGRRLVRQPAVTMPDLNAVKAAVAGGAGFTVLPVICASRSCGRGRWSCSTTPTTRPSTRASWCSGPAPPASRTWRWSAITCFRPPVTGDFVDVIP